MSNESTEISIQDVQQILGVSSGDLAVLCRSDKINSWSRYKPIRYANRYLLKSPVKEDVTNAIKLDECSVLRCGMSVVELTETQMKDKGGGSIKGFAEQFFGTPTNFTRTYDPFTSIHVTGGEKQPYRLADFSDYYHAAVNPFQINPCYDSHSDRIDVIDGGTYYLPIKIYHNAYATYNVMPEDILDGSYSRWKLRVETYSTFRQSEGGNLCEYYNGNLTSSRDNYQYGECDIPIGMPAGFPSSYPVTFTPYLYDIDTQYCVLLPCSRPFSISFGARKRIVNVNRIYNSEEWSSLYTETTLYTNSIRLELNIEKNSKAVSIGKFETVKARIRVKFMGGEQIITGDAVEQDGTNREDWKWDIPATTENNTYQTTYLQFDGLVNSAYSNYGYTANITLELTFDDGETWAGYGGFSVILRFNP